MVWNRDIVFCFSEQVMQAAVISSLSREMGVASRRCVKESVLMTFRTSSNVGLC